MDTDMAPLLSEFEAEYTEQQKKANPALEATFNYGWALVRSEGRENIRKGRALLEGLLRDGYSERDCLYFIAVAHYRLENPLEARKCLERILRTEPDFRQGLALLRAVDEKINKDGWVGVGLVGLAVASVVGVVSALSKR